MEVDFELPLPRRDEFVWTTKALEEIAFQAVGQRITVEPGGDVVGKVTHAWVDDEKVVCRGRFGEK